MFSRLSSTRTGLFILGDKLRLCSSVADKRIKYIGMSGGRIIYEKLLENNVKVVNGISGGINFSILDAFHSDHHSGRTPIQFISSSNEGNAGFIAEGFAKVSGEAGVILVTSGPGLTNIITPLQDAISDGVPLVAFSGQVPTNIPPDAFQCCDSIALTKPCTKWNHKLNSVEEIPAIVDYAFYIARNGRPGPVHIDCPKDIQTETYVQKYIMSTEVTIDDVRYKYDKGLIRFDQHNELPSINVNQLERIEKLINKSERPILYVGQGAIDCSCELLEFVKKTNIPVTTTLHALGVFDERHPLTLKMIGMHGHATANYMIQKADLILAFGSRFDDRTVGCLKTYAPVAREADKRGTGGFVHVDVRPTQKNLVVNVTEFVNSDCKLFLSELNKLNLLYKKREDWVAALESYKMKYPIIIPTFNDGGISAQQVISELDNQVDTYRERCIFTTGVGVHQMVAAQLITWVAPRSMLSSGSLGTMGVSLGFAIGAKLAESDKIVISIDGDGSFNMTHTELQTIHNLQIPVKILILNNNSEMMAVMWQKLFYNSRFVATYNHNCDYNKLANAYNIYNIYCDNEKELGEKMKAFLEYNGPVLFHTNLRKTPCLPMVSPGKALDDMILEDNNYENIDHNALPS